MAVQFILPEGVSLLYCEDPFDEADLAVRDHRNRVYQEAVSDLTLDDLLLQLRVDRANFGASDALTGSRPLHVRKLLVFQDSLAQ